MTVELVISPMGGAEEKDLIKPAQLELAIVNQFGIDQGLFLRQLGFEPADERVGALILMKTPKRIMSQEWGLYHQDESKDTHLFTVCVQVGPVYRQFLRQIPNPRLKGKYCILTI